MSVHKLSLLCLVAAGLAIVPAANGQSVQPVISEYQEHAEGSFTVTNTTLSPMVAVMEPRSFSINQEGNGEFRPLDKDIQLDLSTMSVRLEPQQTATIFYKVKAAKSPAWLVVYATFSPTRANAGLNVRIMLPHTIYLYQKQTLKQDAIASENLTYDPQKKTISVDLTNRSNGLIRVQSVEAAGHRASATAAGFPLLPGNTRKLTMEWTAAVEPERVTVQFGNFDLKLPISGTHE